MKELLRKTKYRNKELEISIADLLALWEKQQGLCAYTNAPMTISSNSLFTVSLDRRDSTIGYVRDNVQLVCASINTMKHNYSEEDFLMLCRMVTQNNKTAEHST